MQNKAVGILCDSSIPGCAEPCVSKAFAIVVVTYRTDSIYGIGL